MTPGSNRTHRPIPSAAEACARALLALAALGLLRPGSTALAQRGGPVGTVTEVRVVGAKSVPEDKIRAQLRTRPGREYNERVIEEDVSRLIGTRWFSDVRPFYKKDPARDGLIVTFRVVELPVVEAVEFRGMTKLKVKDVEESTGLKAGARADHTKAILAAQQIERMYADKGYEWADVRLLEGDKPGQTKIVFEVFEGPKCRLRSIGFTGNAFASSGVLRTKVGSRTAILGIGGVYHRDEIDEDARKLRDYYHDQGFFEAKVRPVVRPDANMGDLRVEFVIWEGVQFKVREIRFEGNKYLTESQLREGLVLHSGKPFQHSLKEADLKNLQTKYGTIGCIDARVDIERKYADPEKAPGVVDLVYRIDEGVPYRLGNLIVQGNERTMDAVVRREANMAGLVPGEPIDLQRIEKFKQRLGNLRYFATTPDNNQKPIDVRLVNRRPADQPFSRPAQTTDAFNEVVRTRLQDPGAGFDELTGSDRPEAPVQTVAAPPAGTMRAPVRIQRDDQVRRAAAAQAEEPLAPDDGPARVAQNVGPFDPPLDAEVPAIEAPAPIVGPAAPPPGAVLPPPGPVQDGRGTRTPPYGADVPPGGFPSIPGMNMTDVGPDRQEPFPDRSFADIITSVDEIPTGRMMLGVGASSFGGLSGNFILHETNFDLFNFPRSFGDLTGGRAFRGRGQDFRLELSPGTAINRAVISLSDPYLFNLPIGASASGYAFNRFYPEWTEDRGGGRFSIGRQFGTSIYADTAFRIEDVDVYGFRFPAPAEYLAVSGHTTLATIRPSVRFDNRNDPFSPSAGSYVEFAFEQGWGTFTYPKVTIEGRTHFMTGSRADGSGKRVLTLRGFYGATGRDTPLYEKFFAGDFRSMRGFAYRGVGPRVLDRNVGGVSTLIGSVEWQFPWTANDRFQQVVFSDFGTVEDTYSIENFRVAVGTGLRVFLPPNIFGPLPLAFDVAFPIVKAPGDRERFFTFFIGAFW
jgi:outer membrane protein insertion porin family